jgi:hypothetical protein
MILHVQMLLEMRLALVLIFSTWKVASPLGEGTAGAALGVPKELAGKAGQTESNQARKFDPASRVNRERFSFLTN